MIKRKHLIYIFFSVIAALAIVAGVVFGTKGVNVSYDWNGGNQIKVVCESADVATQAKTSIKNTLKQNKISINSTRTYSNGVNEIVEITTKDKKINENVNATITANIVALGATTNGFEKAQSTYSTAAWIIPVTAIALCLAGALVAYFITRKTSNILTFIIGYISTAIAELSLFVITRIEIGTESVVGCFIGLVIFTALSIVLLSEVKSQQNTAKHENSDLYSISNDVRQTSVLRLAVLYIVIMLASIVTVVVGGKDLMFFGISLIIAIAADLYSAYILLLETKCALDGAFDEHYENKMNSAEPENSPKQNTKKARPQANAPQKVISKKRKKRNRSDKVVV